MIRPCHATLVAVAIGLNACGAKEPSDALESEATSAQDPQVNKLRQMFEESGRKGLAEIGSTSATGMTTSWNNCIERSARRNDASTQTVSYVFSGSSGTGDEITNSGTAFGKLFLVDATQGHGDQSPRWRDAIGYPAKPGARSILANRARI